MIEELKYKQTKIIVSQYDTEGHSPLKVIADDLNPYVLKFPKNANDNVAIVKEFLCHYLLKCWSIPTPDIAGLSIPDDVLSESLIITNREKRLISNSVWFGSLLLPEPIELMDFISVHNSASQKRILNSEDILKIGLFDIWIENEDRRPTNNNILLSSTNKGFILNPIDHAFTFSTLNFSELTYSTVNFSDNDSILYTPLAKSVINKTQINREFYSKSEEMFYLCIDFALAAFPQIINNIPKNLGFTEEDKTILADFLFSKERNVSVFKEFCYIINLISQ
jgi:hypothetical protein